MKRNRTIFFLFFFLSLIASCDEPIVGGPCDYVDIEGIATITSISEPDSEGRVEVMFDFVPDDSNAVENYLFPNWPDTDQTLSITGGQNPTKEWVEEQGLIEESEHICIRSEITKGTCTPVIFSFPDLDFPDQ